MDDGRGTGGTRARHVAAPLPGDEVPPAAMVPLGVARPALAEVLPRLLLDAVVREPAVRYLPRVLESAAALDALDRGLLSLAVVEHDVVPPGRDHEPINPRRVAAVPDGGRLSLAEELSWEALAAHPVALGLDARHADGDVPARLRRVVADGAVTVLLETEAARHRTLGVAFRPIARRDDVVLSVVWAAGADPRAREALAGAACDWR